VIEQILNGTAERLGYRMPFTFVHDGNYVTENKLKIQTRKKLNTWLYSDKIKHNYNQNNAKKPK